MVVCIYSMEAHLYSGWLIGLTMDKPQIFKWVIWPIKRQPVENKQLTKLICFSKEKSCHYSKPGVDLQSKTPFPLTTSLSSGLPVCHSCLWISIIFPCSLLILEVVMETLWQHCWRTQSCSHIYICKYGRVTNLFLNHQLC